MTPKEYLQQIEKMKNTIKRKERELLLFQCIATSTTAPIGRDPVQTSGISNKPGDYVVNAELLEKEITALKKAFETQITECIDVINKVREIKEKTAELQYNILHKRYVSFKKLKQIAKELHYDYDYIRKMHGIALLNVEKFMPKQ